MVSASSYSTVVMLCFHPSFQHLSSHCWKEVKCSGCVHVGKLLICCENAYIKVVLWVFLWREPDASIACIGELQILPVKSPLTSSILRKAHCVGIWGFFIGLVCPECRSPLIVVDGAKASTGSCRYLCPHFAIADLHLPSKCMLCFLVHTAPHTCMGVCKQNQNWCNDWKQANSYHVSMCLPWLGLEFLSWGS